MNNENKIESWNSNGHPHRGVQGFEKVMKGVLDLGQTCEGQFKAFSKMTVVVFADGKLNLFEIEKDGPEKPQEMAKGIVNIRV